MTLIRSRLFLPMTSSGQPTSLDKAGLLELCAKTSMSDGSYLTTVYDSEDALVGYHVITVTGERNEVMGAAEIREGKAYEYHHLRTPRGE